MFNISTKSNHRQ